MSRSYGPSLLVIAIVVMALAVYSIPFPGNLVPVAAAAGGLVAAAFLIARKPRE